MDYEKKGIIKESKQLYGEINSCITDLVNARIAKDLYSEGRAIFKMEGLLVGTMQHLGCVIDFLEEHTDCIADDSKTLESEDEDVRKILYEEFKSLHDVWIEKAFSGRCTKQQILAWLEKQKAISDYNRIAPIYNDQESFEDSLDKAWTFYNNSGSSIVDGCEDNPIELAFAKGFREGFICKKQKEQNMPDSTELIERWEAEKEILKEKDFRDDKWRLAQNAFMDGFAYGCSIKQKEKVVEFDHFKEEEPQEEKFNAGDVLRCTSTGRLWLRRKEGDNVASDGHTCCIGGGFVNASEQETDAFFHELKNNGYLWSPFKKDIIKIEQKPVKIHIDNPNIQKLDPNVVIETTTTGTSNAMEQRPADCSACSKSLQGYINGRSDAEIKLLNDYGIVIMPDGELRMKPRQKPAEWSDNDDQLIGFIFDLLNDLVWRKDWAMSKEECLERLKSLRPQPHWKPSDEQMCELNWASKLSPTLVSLYNDLKKL